MFKVPEKLRITDTFHPMKSDSSYGNNGAFILPFTEKQGNKITKGRYLLLASDGLGWEHVNIHKTLDEKTVSPTWDDLTEIKNLFWCEDDCVVQYHQEKKFLNGQFSKYDLWRPVHDDIPIPPPILLGNMNK